MSQFVDLRTMQRRVDFALSELKEISDLLKRTDVEFLISPQEAAEILSVSRQYVYNLATEGKLPTVRLGGAMRIRRSDIESFIRENTG